MKNFDDMLAQDREFTVGGETFRWHDVRPEVLMAFGENTELDGLPLMDSQVMLFLEPDDRERWSALRAREENPVTIAQMTAIITWLVEQQSDRPTVQPSPSVVGRGPTKATSKAA